MGTSQRQEITAIIKDKKGRILSIGTNSYHKTHPMQAKCAHKVGMPERIYLHAEIDAIVRCNNISKAHSIHIFRKGKDRKFLLAKPCPVCQEAISMTPIKEIFFT